MVNGIYDFLALPETEQCAYTWNHATFLISRIAGNYGYHVYACHDFYIEITYNRAGNKLEVYGYLKIQSSLNLILTILGFRRKKQIEASPSTH
jgi:hypothetical protein